MEVGTIVRLKIPCLGNPVGSIGVVYYDYDEGFQAIFENGRYDGFSNEPNSMTGGFSEADYFLEKIRIESSLIDYEFLNVSRVSQDFRDGIFDVVFKRPKSEPGLICGMK